jgi:hypothetical protein
MTIPFAVLTADQWKFQQSYIERMMDHSALTSAHPDDTLVLAGPARAGFNSTATSAGGAQNDILAQMLPLGMLQSFNAMFQKPTQPMQAIGSGRLFFVSGKSQGQAQIARLFCNGRNLLRALYTNAVQAKLDVSKFDDPACATAFDSGDSDAKYVINLDSELFLIPFGLACFFRDKAHDHLGAFYLELCMINSYNIAYNAGQSLILENVSILFDRALPIRVQSNVGGDTGGAMTDNMLSSATLMGADYDPTATTSYGDLANK